MGGGGTDKLLLNNVCAYKVKKQKPFCPPSASPCPVSPTLLWQTTCPCSLLNNLRQPTQGNSSHDYSAGRALECCSKTHSVNFRDTKITQRVPQGYLYFRIAYFVCLSNNLFFLNCMQSKNLTFKLQWYPKIYGWVMQFFFFKLFTHHCFSYYPLWSGRQNYWDTRKLAPRLAFQSLLCTKLNQLLCTMQAFSGSNQFAAHRGGHRCLCGSKMCVAVIRSSLNFRLLPEACSLG